jgi:hypothetical protein
MKRVSKAGHPYRRARGIAQSGSAGVLGTPGRRFESGCPDQVALPAGLGLTRRIWWPNHGGSYLHAGEDSNAIWLGED